MGWNLLMIVITFDTDWIDEQILESLNLIEKVPGSMTFFCTGYYKCLDDYENVEIALHPRLDWQHDWIEETNNLKKQFSSNIIGIRPHSCSYSQYYGVQLAKMGFKYISQATFLYKKGLEPFKHPWGLWEFPIYYMDNMDFSHQLNWTDSHNAFNNEIIMKAITDESSLFVFDFHPIHLYLNSPNIEFYDRYKHLKNAIKFDGIGSLTFFNALCDAMKKNNIKAKSLKSIFDEINRE